MNFAGEPRHSMIVPVAAGMLIVAALAMAAGAWWAQWRESLLPWAGLTLALAALLLLAQQDRRAAWLHAHLQHSLLTRGAGVYGVLTLARFLQLELHDLVTGWGGFVIDETLLRAFLRDWLIGFSVQSLHNSIEAVMWPLMLLRAFGWPALVVVFAAFQPLSRLAARLAGTPEAPLSAASDPPAKRAG